MCGAAACTLALALAGTTRQADTVRLPCSRTVHSVPLLFISHRLLIESRRCADTDWEYDQGWPDSGYWQYPALLGEFDAHVEGSITDIADEETAAGVFDGHALTRLSTGHHAIYYGGPTMGWKHTSESSMPAAAETLARFADVTNVTGSAPPAVVRMRERGKRLLLFSVHLEAFEGVGVSELSTADRQANYALRAARILAEMR